MESYSIIKGSLDLGLVLSQNTLEGRRHGDKSRFGINRRAWEVKDNDRGEGLWDGLPKQSQNHLEQLNDPFDEQQQVVPSKNPAQTHKS